MNFSQLHERVRLEVLRRIERGALTATLLSTRTGLRQPHISNFLRRRRSLSLPALDRVVAALNLSVSELVPSQPAASPDALRVPLVSDDTAMDREQVPALAGREYLQLPEATLALMRRVAGLRGLRSDRFVAVAVTEEQAEPMAPLLHAGSLAILDRHAGLPAQRPAHSRSFYAVRLRGRMRYFHVAHEHNMLVLRPHAQGFPVQLLPVEPQARPADYLVGRVCAVVSPA